MQVQAIAAPALEATLRKDQLLLSVADTAAPTLATSPATVIPLAAGLSDAKKALEAAEQFAATAVSSKVPNDWYCSVIQVLIWSNDETNWLTLARMV